MKEYTYRFTKTGLTSTFIAETDQQANDIANNYAKNILKNVDFVECTHIKNINIYD